jgi:hypothetical protein
MDHQRFDAWTRELATLTTRRGVMRRAGLAAVAATLAGLFGRSQRAAAHHCDYIGCGCATGARHACGRGLVCCPSSPGLPGGAGICAPRGECGGGCVEEGDACPGYCNWGDVCPDCCSGYCGQFGACDTQVCTGVGCSCTTGTLSPCDYGLVCCSIYSGLPGGAGVCQYGCG